MKVKKLLTVGLALCLGVCTLFAGCDRGGVTGANGTLKITYYKGGTGDEWIEEMAAEFEQLTDIKVELTADAKATENAKTLLESDRDLPDLMFILYTNWHEYVQKGWLADMDDLYDGTFSYEVNGIEITSQYDVGDTSVYAESGETTGLTLMDTMDSGFVNYGKMAPKTGEEEHFYVMPWTSPCTGIVYNVDILESVGYSEPPATEAELKDLCEKLVAKGIAPFSWGGQEMGYWSFPVLTWWAQYSGIETWENFYQFESPEVFNDEGSPPLAGSARRSRRRFGYKQHRQTDGQRSHGGADAVRVGQCRDDADGFLDRNGGGRIYKTRIPHENDGDPARRGREVGRAAPEYVRRRLCLHSEECRQRRRCESVPCVHEQTGMGRAVHAADGRSPRIQLQAFHHRRDERICAELL